MNIIVYYYEFVNVFCGVEFAFTIWLYDDRKVAYIFVGTGVPDGPFHRRFCNTHRLKWTVGDAGPYKMSAFCHSIK